MKLLSLYNKHISGVVATKKTESNLSLPSWAEALYPLANLYRVDDKLFRSEQLGADEIVLLDTYEIDAVINLRFFNRNHNEKHFALLPDPKAIELYNYPMMPWYVSSEHIAKVLYEICSLHAQDKSVLVHCLHGADRTGIIIAMYRIVVQGWSVEHAKTEMIQGSFGYHAIWRNLENMLNISEVEQVRQVYTQLMLVSVNSSN